MWSEWEVNFFEVLKRLVAWFYRKPVFLAFINVIASGLNYSNGLFVSLRNAIIYKLTWNTQIVMLEKFLNDKFNIPYDPATRDADIASHTIIWIESLNTVNKYLYNDIENRPATYLYNDDETTPVYLKNGIELYASNHFTINFPAAVAYDEIIVRGWVNPYRLASKSYSIDTY